VILHFVRHPQVITSFRHRCYGHSDVGLSRQGAKMITPLVDQLSALEPAAIVHSDMRRTHVVAAALSTQLGIVAIAAPLWRERNFGTWEGQTWNAIYRATGNAMDGMIHNPDHFCPGGGETTRALINRTHQALAQLPDVETVVIIAHGGPIACARIILDDLPVNALVTSIPPPGAVRTHITLRSRWRPAPPC
jgi:broad specificity phosphatase PhoE